MKARAHRRCFNRIAASILVCLCIGMCACGRNDAQTSGRQKFGGFIDAFDTVIEIDVWCTSQKEFDELFSVAETMFSEYHRLFDIYEIYPDIVNLRSINDAAGTAPLTVTSELMEFLHFCCGVYDMTGGNVNVCIGPVTALWHDARERNNASPGKPVLPDDDVLREAGEHCSISNLRIDDEDSSVMLTDPSSSLDVGALAKGYAAEMVAKELKARGYDSISINAGGNVRVVGSKPSGNWKIAITNPDRDVSASEPYIGTVSVADCAVVTSGVYQRFFTADGRCYHHIIDKDTLYPEERYRSVTVIFPNSALADAYSTALFNMPYDEGAELAEETDGLEAMWIGWDFSIRMTDGFEEVFTSM